jgi:hypothetical protein
LRDRESCEFHELIDGKGASAHKLLVQSGGGLGPECLESHDDLSEAELAGSVYREIKRKDDIWKNLLWS